MGAVLFVLTLLCVLLWLLWRISPEYRSVLHAAGAADELRAEANALLELPSEAERHQRAAAGAYVEERRADMRRAVPINELKSYGVKNVRWNSLTAAGLETLDDLHGKSPTTLIALPGVGQASAERVLAGATAAIRSLEKHPVPMPGGTLSEAASASLVACVARAKRMSELPADCLHALPQRVQQVMAKRRGMMGQATMLRWAFAGQGRGQDGSIARAAHVVLEAVRDARASAEFTTIQHEVDLINAEWPPSLGAGGRARESVRAAYAGLQDAITEALRAVAPSVVNWRTDFTIAPMDT